jgi:ABC-type microcin C transport system duplicated ATPase subunit YejF
VGESGSGKSTLVRCISRLITADSGEINFLGQDLLKLNRNQLKNARRNMQMIFQDPLESLNPRMKIIDSVSEGLLAYKIMPKTQIRHYLEQIFADCKLDISALDKYPSEFSGGQRQRICIAKAIAMKPSLLIADEAVSALDLSVQKTILLMLNELKEKYNLSILFITHDLRVVKEIADSVIVMQSGKIAEQGCTKQVFTKPKSDYTSSLITSIPGQILQFLTKRCTCFDLKLP